MDDVYLHLLPLTFFLRGFDLGFYSFAIGYGVVVSFLYFFLTFTLFSGLGWRGRWVEMTGGKEIAKNGREMAKKGNKAEKVGRIGWKELEKGVKIGRRNVHLLLNKFQPPINGHDGFAALLLQQDRSDEFVDLGGCWESVEFLCVWGLYEIGAFIYLGAGG